MDWSCLLAPGDCINSAIATWIAWFPFGIEGVKAAAWMIVGAILGKVGVGVVLALVAALKVSSALPTEHQYPHPDEKPAPKPKKRRPF